MFEVNNASAALYFLDGQYAIRYTGENGGEVFKYVSPLSVRQAFASEPIDSGWLTSDTIRHGFTSDGHWCINFYPARQWVIRLKIMSETVQLKTTLPSALWVGRGDNYYLLAAKSDVFKPSEQLFHYPLPNINSIGLTCFGSNQTKDATPANTHEAYLTFMRSFFNNHHIEEKSQKHPTNILTALQKANQRIYPLKDLLPIDATPEFIVELISRQK